MAKSASPQKLRIYTEQPPKNVRPQIEAVACMPDLLKAFQATTGWTLKYESGALRLETPKGEAGKGKGGDAASEERPAAGRQQSETTNQKKASLVPHPSSLSRMPSVWPARLPTW